MSVAKDELIKRAEVTSPDPEFAVASLVEQLYQDEIAGIIFFCSANYDSETLAAKFKSRFDCPVVGCTTAGEIGTRYQENGIVAASFAKSHFRFHSYLIPNIADFDAKAAIELGDTVRNALELSNGFHPEKMFGLLLLDGLSMQVESVAANISTVMKDIPMVGGSAGNNLEFKEILVFADGRFHTEAGVLVMIESVPAFHIFKLQNFVPSEKELIITRADPQNRTVSEINGAPAAEEFARIIGAKVQDLSPDFVAKYPVMLEIGDQWYIRTIQKINFDGSMTLYCSVDNGLVLVLSRKIDFLKHLEDSTKALADKFSTIHGTIGFDCLRRRLDLFETDQIPEVENALARLNFIGFSTFGEQFNGIHLNHTLTGVVIGEK